MAFFGGNDEERQYGDREDRPPIGDLDRRDGSHHNYGRRHGEDDRRDDEGRFGKSEHGRFEGGEHGRPTHGEYGSSESGKYGRPEGGFGAPFGGDQDRPESGRFGGPPGHHGRTDNESGAPEAGGYGKSNEYGRQEGGYGSSAFQADTEKNEEARKWAIKKAEEEERENENNEIMAGVGALAAAGIAAWQAHEAVNDPANRKSHAAIAAAAGAVAVGAGAYAVHEHMDQKKLEEVQESLGDTEKKHGWF